MKRDTEKLKTAVALAYHETDAAPRVIAKGKGILAENIIAKAHEHGLYVHESPEMVALLMQVDVDQRIPPQLYVAVAELLAWIYHMETHPDSQLPAPADLSNHFATNPSQLADEVPSKKDGLL